MPEYETKAQHTQRVDTYSSQGIRIGALAIMTVGAAFMLFQELTPERNVRIDTRMETGTHVTFVLVAPTSTADKAYVEAVRVAKTAMRAFAADSRYYYSTIGVSDEWVVQSGLQILSEFGAFDEVIVGRNWFNTGVQKYITTMMARPVVPQVVITVQDIDINVRPSKYGEVREVARFVGSNSLQDWIRTGFRVD